MTDVYEHLTVYSRPLPLEPEAVSAYGLTNVLQCATDLVHSARASTFGAGMPARRWAVALSQALCALVDAADSDAAIEPTEDPPAMRLVFGPDGTPRRVRVDD